jgi:hypothetical protein
LCHSLSASGVKRLIRMYNVLLVLERAEPATKQEERYTF